MKTSRLLTAGLYVVLLSRTVSGVAQDRWNPNVGRQQNSGFNGGMSRSLFGLPLPQQWSGVRPTGMSRGVNGSGYAPAGYSANCANGQCQTGNAAIGQVATGRSPNGQLQRGACPNGQRVNGQYLPGDYSTGYRGMNNCPNGQCPQGAQAGWMPRSARSMPADPFRRSGTQSDRDQWIQRPVLAPLNDSFGRTQYNREELDLRSEYFGDESNDRYDLRESRQSGSGVSSDDWSRPSRRSLEAPADTRSGIARF